MFYTPSYKPNLGKKTQKDKHLPKQCLNLRRNRKFHEEVASPEPSSFWPSESFMFSELAVFSFDNMRPVKGQTGRVSRGPPLRPIATIGGGGSNPALKRMRCTGSEGWAPTDSQYLHREE